MTPTRWGALVGLVIGVIALGPALAPGFLLHYDMVFGPALTFDAQTMGWDGSYPRAVPNDALVAALSVLMPGWVAQKLVLLAAFIGAGSGAAALVARIQPSTGGAIVAAVVATWNPWVAERLAIGHWGYLLGYACLSWVAVLSYDLRHARASGRWLPVALIAAAWSGSTGLVLAWIVVVCILRLRSALVYSALVGLLAAPWWFPAIFLVEGVPGDPAGVAGFAARAHDGGAAVMALLSGGGIWNAAVHFPERTNVLIVVASAAISLGLVVVATKVNPRWRRVLLVGFVGLALSLLPSLPGGREVLEWAVENAPGAGLLRDSHKFAALWVVAVATAAGICAARLGQQGSIPAPARRWFLVVLAMWPIALMPSLTWGYSGRWQATEYPEAVTELTSTVNAASSGDVAVFPWSTFRRFDWNHDRVVLDPWMRLIDRPVLTSDDLLIDGHAIAGENSRTRPISEVMSSSSSDSAALVNALREAGVRWVIEWTDQPEDASTAWPREPGGATLMGEYAGLRWWDLGEVEPWLNSRTAARAPWFASGWALFVVGLGVGALLMTRRPKTLWPN